MNVSKLLTDIHEVEKSKGDKWTLLYRNGVQMAAIYYDGSSNVQIEHRSRGVYLIWSGCLRTVADEYKVCSY